MSISEGQLSEILRHNRQMEVISRETLDLLEQMNKKMSEEDSQNLKEIKELLQAIDRKTTAYMKTKLYLSLPHNTNAEIRRIIAPTLNKLG